MAEDHQAVNDLKAMEKGARMFLANRVLACSVFFEGYSTYFSGIVGASMKNKVSYNYKIKVDKTGAPVISHCECPAGKGPHATCKHIAAVLLMVEHFLTTGSLHVERSCTESLQTFHKPKSMYKGSPVKVESLPSKRKWSDKMLEDPRPQKYRRMAGFDDHVRNMMVNFCSATSLDLALRYLHPKADLQSAVLDHNYLEKPYTEYWVDRALQVTDDEAVQIEKSTRDQVSSQRWHRERKGRLTASRFGEITKMSSRRNKNKLCSSLLYGRVSTRPIIHGRQYEKKAIAHFETCHKVKTKKAGFFIDKDIPFLGATPDAVTDDNCLVEVKCPYAGRNDMIKRGKKFPYLLYDSTGKICLNPRSNYYHQVQGQLYIAKRKYCYFVVYTFCDMFVEKIILDHEYFLLSMLPKLELFYQQHFRPYIASVL